ncbi:MAG: hypothetical protein K8R69_04315 [Deltaproteobacteria bacterium]|nr:hypothetical protein [Deltaproteobacteria bacterium]
MKFTISSENAGERLDRYLAKHCADLSRSQIKHLIEAGDILSNSKPTKASQVLKGGEEILVKVPPPIAMATLPEDLPLHILYEDPELIVLNKDAEMVVHLGAGVKDGTVVNALLHHCRVLSGIGGVARPGIVHRLDK